MVSEVMPETPAGYGGYVLAAFIALFSYVGARRKTDVEESAVVLAAWKELMDGHKDDMAVLKAEFAAYKLNAIEEISGLRTRLTAVETEFANYRVEAAKHITARDEEIAGLKRSIGQNSQSAAYLIGGTNKRMDRADARLDRVKADKAVPPHDESEGDSA